MTNTPPSFHKPNRVLRVAIIISLLIIVVIGLNFIFRPKGASNAGARGGRGGPGGPITITTGTAQKGNIGVYIDAIGTVTPVYTASIFSQVTGVIVTVNYKEGQIVKKGDPLTDIDDRPFRATLMQAEGTLERDTNVLGQAQMDLQRYQEAWSRNAVAKQILDDQGKLVLQDEGTVKLDQGIVQFDQIQVDYCHINAPFDGRVGLRLIDPGNLVSAGGSVSSNGTPLVVITEMQPITVIFTIPEDSLDAVQAQLSKGSTLTVEALDRSGQTKIATGELQALDNQIDTTTGTVKLRAVFNNDDNALFPNQFVNTRLLVQTLEGVTLIPSATIQQNGQASFVYVIKDNVAHLQNVKPGVTDKGVTQVDGISPGDVVANSSFDKLQDNSTVSLDTGKPSGDHQHGGGGGPGGGKTSGSASGGNGS